MSVTEWDGHAARFIAETVACEQHDQMSSEYSGLHKQFF